MVRSEELFVTADIQRVVREEGLRIRNFWDRFLHEKMLSLGIFIFKRVKIRQAKSCCSSFFTDLVVASDTELNPTPE
jgi:hypothetical protein